MNDLLRMEEKAAALQRAAIRLRLQGLAYEQRGDGCSDPERFPSNAIPVTILGYTDSLTAWAERLGTARQTLAKWIKDKRDLDVIAYNRGVKLNK